MVGWHHWLNVHVFGQALGDDEGHGSMACFCSLSHKQSLATEQHEQINIWYIILHVILYIRYNMIYSNIYNNINLIQYLLNKIIFHIIKPWKE